MGGFTIPLSLRALPPIMAAGALALSALPVLAQEHPSRPIKIAVCFAAGGVTDVLTRALAVTTKDRLPSLPEVPTMGEPGHLASHSPPTPRSGCRSARPGPSSTS